MVADWIRMRTDLYRDPKVCLIADHLLNPSHDLARYVNQNCQRDMAVTRNVMRNVTVGALVTVWGVTRHRGKRINDADIIVRGVTLSVVDDIADLPGFGDAMASVGWALQTEDGVVFPNFFEDFNADPHEEAKAKNAERQRRYREKQEEKRNALRNVTVTSKSNGREEKSREENKEKKSTKRNADSAYTLAFEHFWTSYPTRRRSGKGAAWKAWQAAIATTDPSSIIDAAREYAQSDVGRGEFCKMPSTWLNQRCWEDDRAAWKQFDSQQTDEPAYPKAQPYKIRKPENLAQ